MEKEKHSHKHTEAEIQEKVIIYQLLNKQLEELRRDAVIIQERLLELDGTRQAIEELKKPREDVLIPIGSGFYLYGKITGKKILSNVGADVMVDRSVEDAIEMIEEKKKELERLKSDVERDTNNVVKTINEMLPEIQEMIREVQEGEK